MAKRSKRSKTARAIRSLQELTATAEMLLKNRRKKQPGDFTHPDQVIRHLAVITALENTKATIALFQSELVEAGFVHPAGSHDLTPAEVEEVVALRYRGLQGKPLFTMAALAQQYGISKEAVAAIDYDVPM